jgi:aspartyl-tRNA(Asn)/glutamyl-tRNA(Gln) amidotransferase subunit C
VTLTFDQVRHVASLARLLLTPEEEERYKGQLSAILDAAAELQSLDTKDVPPTSHASEEALALGREDELAPSLPPGKALGNAPAKLGTSFAVPKILE